MTRTPVPTDPSPDPGDDCPVWAMDRINALERLVLEYYRSRDTRGAELDRKAELLLDMDPAL